MEFLISGGYVYSVVKSNMPLCNSTIPLCNYAIWSILEAILDGILGLRNGMLAYYANMQF